MMLKSGLAYTGTVTARSASEPSPADALTYTVVIDAFGQSIPFEGVSPQPSARWSSYMPTGGEVPNLIPFEIGRMVTVHLTQQGPNYRAVINDAEIPEFGPCDEGTP